MENFKDLMASIEIKNIEGLNILLQKATDQMEQLEKTIKAIEKIELSINLAKT